MLTADSGKANNIKDASNRKLCKTKTSDQISFHKVPRNENTLFQNNFQKRNMRYFHIVRVQWRYTRKKKKRFLNRR
ncbi:MAG: hypothetical protein C4520_11685 [Candidatus Abyssobacteria bacterium SURF_5]|uniref:Uncharacterized protein n=1 Tax=Abyssobacteria bacterium (strain SURF_5) TaxID=2093360 RepID=A0A3A4NLZ9_ABYX5|nr:MAG: hypothetical protein C4520_11685 [Candidatus Abyssubacteria bacterium SURF_5]